MFRCLPQAWVCCTALCGLLAAFPASAQTETDSTEDNSQLTAQQENMAENLGDSVTADTLARQLENQEIENPRIAVQENLDEMREVSIVEDEAEIPEQETSLVQIAEGEIEEIEEELSLDGEEKLGYRLVEGSDRVMEWSRKPLTYVQDHVPFLTKRNILFFGRLELDGAMYSSGTLQDENGFIIRRFRLGLAGQMRLLDGWNYKVELDLTDGENTLSDAYISWRSKRWGTFRIGNQKVAQTLSGQTSSLSVPFMERPLPVLAFTLQRRLGVGWDTHLRRLGANVTLFTRDPNKGVGSEGWAARGYFNPTRAKFHVIHVGASYMQLASDDDAGLRARPESHVTDIRLVDTGKNPDVDSTSAFGLELAGARDSVTFRSEFYTSEWARPADDNPRFKGFYVEASWFTTGEKAHYRDGKFIRPNIKSEYGAWEIAVRFSRVDLDDLDIAGGIQTNASVGLNWYSQTHWRFMANLIKAKVEGGPYGDQNPWIGQLRAQYYF